MKLLSSAVARNCKKFSCHFLLEFSPENYFLIVSQERLYSSAANNFRSILQSQLDGIKEAGTFKSERVITSPQKSKISVEGMKTKVLNFCANNYLGLSANEEIKEHAKLALDKYGSGLSSVRFICGKMKHFSFDQRDIDIDFLFL